MNWIDFNILCVGQKKPAVYKNEIFDVEVMNKNPNKTKKCYISVWDIMNRINGIWYELWVKKDENDFIIDSTWNQKDDYGYQLFVLPEKVYIIKDILKYYLEKSPIKKIIVLFRHQADKEERFERMISLDDFIEKLVSKDIYGNLAYIIK